MKKLFLFAILLTMVMVGCSEKISTLESNSKDTVAPQVVTLYAHASEVTRTSYAGDKTFSWTAGDKISVLYHNDLNEPVWVEFTASTSAASSAFTATVPGGLTIGAPTTGVQWALYPANENHVYTNDSTIGFAQAAVVDGTTAKIPMIATLASGSSDAYHFRQMGGALKFTVKNIRTEVSRIRLEFNTSWGDKYVSGVFSVQNPDSATPSIVYNSMTSDASRLISATANVESNNSVVYLPLPVLEAWASFYINVYDADNGVLLCQKKISSGCVTASRQRIDAVNDLTLPDVDRSRPIQIDGYISSDWSGSGIYSFVSENPNRIKTWKATSDADYIYFLFQLVKAKINTSSPRWGNFICSGFDFVAESGGTTVNNYHLGDGLEAFSINYFVSSVEDGKIIFVNGEETNGNIECPVQTDTGNHVITAGFVDGDDAWVEMSIRRDQIGATASGITMTAIHSFDYYNTGRQSFVLE